MTLYDMHGTILVCNDGRDGAALPDHTLLRPQQRIGPLRVQHSSQWCVRWKFRSLDSTSPRFGRVFEAPLTNGLRGFGGEALDFSHAPKGRRSVTARECTQSAKLDPIGVLDPDEGEFQCQLDDYPRAGSAASYGVEKRCCGWKVVRISRQHLTENLDPGAVPPSGASWLDHNLRRETTPCLGFRKPLHCWSRS